VVEVYDLPAHFRVRIELAPGGDEIRVAARNGLTDMVADVRRRAPRKHFMALWIEENLFALFVGAGLGATVTHWFFPDGMIWLIGAVAGIGVAVPLWQIFNKPRRPH